MPSKYNPGERFYNLEQVKKEKVVWSEPWGRAVPVAFFLSWQWRMVDRWVYRGLIRKAVIK